MKINNMKLEVFASAADVRPNDGHGSKIIVVLFDGAALDRDLQSATGSSK